jgi:GNAT superfamily N-acetyltransferase
MPRFGVRCNAVTNSASKVPFSVEELDPRRHDRADFDCGVEPLNLYLKTLAAQHRAKGIATTFVLVDSEQPAKIRGYYSLSAASLAFERLTETDRKGLPKYPIPAVRIGRLATAAFNHGMGLGELLLQNAVKRVLQARLTLGVYAIVVEAKDESAEAFYRKYGFRLCDLETRQLYLPLGEL